MTKKELNERVTAIKAAIAEKSAEVTTMREELSVTVWAELDSGASIKVGDRVRYLGKIYVCAVAHTKALTRRPTVTEYWAKEAGA